MTALYWHTCGEGKRDFVLLHGWGLNADIWHCIINRLAPHFRLHLVDLPGYGRSSGYGDMSLSEMATVVLNQAPEKALWLGWSMGGLVASQIALNQPEQVIDTVLPTSLQALFFHQKGRLISARHTPVEVICALQHRRLFFLLYCVLPTVPIETLLLGYK